MSGMDPARWYRDALWAASADELSTTELAVGLCYAKFSDDGETAWVVERELMRHCKIRSQSTVVRVRAEMVKKGWLSPIGPRPAHKQVTVYRLCIPENRCDHRTGSASHRPLWTGAIIDETGAMVGAKPVRSSVPSQKRLKSPVASGRAPRTPSGASLDAPAKKGGSGCTLCGAAVPEGWRLCGDCATEKDRCAVCVTAGLASGYPVCGRDQCTAAYLKGST